MCVLVYVCVRARVCVCVCVVFKIPCEVNYCHIVGIIDFGLLNF